MTEAKTQQTDADVLTFINKAPTDTKREDALTVLGLMTNITNMEPKMWGASIIGFGSYHYKYDSGHEGDAPLLGFSPRKANLVLYVLTNFKGQGEMLKKLGKHKTGKVCLYINKLADIDLSILEDIVQNAFNHMIHVYKPTVR
ncbi:MAG: DUF1801 domain-containing protein [Flavobacteriales bacterium]|nr:DUF1801 domain-containing protein [Flavobacteriales bacterium]PCH87869.1 MAG: hypothetical protein COB88_04825 [Flavobacteriales bacterium]